MTESPLDLIVIGAGPAGYTAAIRAAQLGMSVACVERESALGGTCLRVGCIPSKALLEASERYEETKRSLGRFGIEVGSVELDLDKMMMHKERTVKTLTQGVAGLLKKNGVERYLGSARLLGAGRVAVVGEEQSELSAERILIATGSSIASLPGVELDGDRIGGSTEALCFPAVPDHLVVIGAGVIGLELGSVWARLGARVTVLEYLDRILPGMDLELARGAQKALKKQGLSFRLGSRVTGAHRAGGQVTVEVEGAEPLEADRVLVAVGRRPNTDGLGVEEVGIELDRQGRIVVDPESFETKVPGVFAVGDVIAGPMLAHKAEEEAVACVERIATGYGHVSYDAIPAIVYTHPEIASVGRTEEELVEAGIDYVKGMVPFSANGRARAIAQTSGFVKLLAGARTDRLLGAHILGARAGDLIAELAMAIELRLSAEDVARTCHAHPTLSEVVKEAALAVADRAVNY